MKLESLSKALELIKQYCSQNEVCKTCALYYSDRCSVISSGAPKIWVIKEQTETKVIL